MHRVLGRHQPGDDGVARLVIGCELLFLFGIDPALLFVAHDNLQEGIIDFPVADLLLGTTGGQQSRFVQQVLQIGAGEAGGGFGDGVKIHILFKGLFPGVNLHDGLTAFHIGHTDIHLPVKASRTQQGTVQNVGTVGGRQDNDSFIGPEAVHLHQQLIEGLFSFVVAAAQTGSSLAAHSVDLIDKDDGRRMALGLVKQIPHTGSAHAHIQFYKVRTGNGEERHTRFSGHRLGDQCFTSARRAHQQNALGNTGAQLQEFFRSLQKLHHFLQVAFFLIGPGHILESHLLIFAVDHLGPGFAEVHGGFPATVLLVHHIIPEQAKEDDNDQIGQKGRPPRHGHLFRKVLGQRSRRPLLTDGFAQIIIEDLQ